MATSPNYGWSEPDNTSLVKDGAQAMRTLGDAIDTSVWNVGFGQAGKNKIINGDFFVNQRSFTSTTTSGVYTFDRWLTSLSDGTVTVSSQAFTPGAAPVAGYESTNFIRLVTSGQTLSSARSVIQQRIEDVRTFANQTATISFWAKAATGTPSVAATFQQVFGSGGSTTVNVTGQKAAITTSWARYSLTFSVPSISGKTIGSSSYLQMRLFTSGGADEATQNASIGIQNATIDIWGVQVEAGSKATPFQTASGGSIQGELAMCQRYFQVLGGASGSGMTFGGVATGSAQTFYTPIPFPVTMRATPTVTKNGTWGVANAGQPAVGFVQPSSFTLYTTSSASGTWYVQADSTDDTVTASAEL